MVDCDKNSKSKFWTVKRSTQILMAITAVGILITAIVYKQAFWRVAPLFVSLFVMLLNARVSRKGLLLGGINSILYAIVYISYKLYASAIYAVLVSCPFQIVAFIRWSRRPSGESTVFKRLSNRMRILLLFVFIVCWASLYLLLSKIGSGYLIWDNTGSLLGIFASILIIFAVIEYTWLQWVSTVISIVLYSIMLAAHPEQITYLIYSIYSLICVTLSVVHSMKLYKTQQKENS